MKNVAFKILKAKVNDLIGRPLPIKLTLALTFMCNSRCKTCNIWQIYKKNPDRKKRELTTENWKNLLNEIGGSLGWVEFTGGEPFLRRDIDEIVIYTYNNTRAVAGGITTNGISSKKTLKLCEKIIENIPKDKILNIGISLDGIPEVHDKIRGVPGNFEEAVWLFNELKQLEKQHENLSVHLSYTISRYNAGRLEDFCKFIKENYNVSINEITMTLEHLTEYYNRKPNGELYKSLKNNLTKDVKYYLRVSREDANPQGVFHKIKSTFYSFYLKNIPRFVNAPKAMIIPCVAGKYSAYIDPYGNVYPCTQWLVKLGNVKEHSFKEIWWSKKAEEVRKIIKNGKCPNCWTPCEAQPSWVMNFGMLRGLW